MLEIQMSKDIKTFEPTVVGPFTFRQLLWMTAGTVLALPALILLPGDITARILIATIIASPLFMCGWIKIQGMYFDSFLKVVFIYTFLRPKRRVNDDMNEYEKSMKREKVQYRKKMDKTIEIYR